MISQGEVWWADLDEPHGSEPGYARPVVIIQGDAFNQSRLPTVVCCALYSNPRLADAPGNVVLPARITGLPKDSVANVSQIMTIDQADLRDYAGILPKPVLQLIFAGVDRMLGRE